MAVKINSRNTLTEVVELLDAATQAKLEPTHVDLRQRVTETGPDDQLITVTATQSWPGLGLTHLDDPTAWWVIADLSDIIDPFTELVPGRELRAPSTHRFYFKILGG